MVGRRLNARSLNAADVSVDALVDPVHRAAHALPLVEGERKAVELADDALAHRVLDPQPDVPAPHPETPWSTARTSSRASRPPWPRRRRAPFAAAELVDEVLHDQRVDCAERPGSGQGR